MDQPEAQQERPSRRQFLKQAGIAAGALAIGGAGYGASRLLGGAESRADVALRRQIDPPAKTLTFHTRPDLHPPGVAAATTPAAEEGFLFVGPGALGQTQAGPLIVDAHGEPVWFSPLPGHGWLANFRTWEYRGEPVLAWWQGDVLRPLGYGQGEAVLVDRSYREVGRVRAVGAQSMDVHELRLTPEGTALFTCHPRPAKRDLTAVGGPREAHVLESVIQEVDVRTGRLLLEWRSLDHIPVEESYRSLIEPYDYVHINSIAVCPDGNLLVSGRHTWALYKLDRRTGEVIWRLGGKRSSFDMGPGTQFGWQHDAEQVDDSTISLFDNRSDGPTSSGRASRGLLLQLDNRGRRVSLGRAFRPPRPLLSSSMGSVQVRPGGHVVVGWGTEPYVSEFAAQGELVAEARMTRGQRSYRGYRLPWRGHPQDGPAIAVAHGRGARPGTVYASWNGATEVAYWQLHRGRHPEGLRAVRTVSRSGFETPIGSGNGGGWAAAVALDAARRPLGSSRPVRLD